MYVERYLVVNRSETEEILGRAEVFFPDIEAALEEADLPDALKYVPVVESLLLPEAISRSGAGGLWQIMPSTGRYMGLRVDGRVDERLDPVLSGRAAIKLLQVLYTEFGDWSLALAAYNCGPGRVRRAIEKAQSREYVRLRLFLPVQTRSYLSKFVAMSHIFVHRQKYGLTAKSEPSFQAMRLKEVPVDGYLDFQEVAVQLGISTEALQRINPHFQFGRAVDSARTISVPDHLAFKLTPERPVGEGSAGFSVKNSSLWTSVLFTGKRQGTGITLWRYGMAGNEVAYFFFGGLQKVLHEEGLAEVVDRFWGKYFVST